MRKSISVILIAILMISLAGCKKNINKEIDKIYKDIESYSAVVRVTVAGNKGAEQYEVSQSYKGGRYRTEVTKPERMKGTLSVISGDEMWLRSAGEPAIYMEKGFSDEQKDYMFIKDFLDEYYSQESLPVLVPDEEGRIMLNLPERGNNEKRFKQSLWIDEKTRIPVCLATYDKNGDEVIRVEYISFVPDAEIEDSVFIP